MDEQDRHTLELDALRDEVLKSGYGYSDLSISDLRRRARKIREGKG